MMPPSPFLTVEGVRDRYHFPSVKAVRAWASRYRVPKHYRGRVLLFLVSECDRIVTARRDVYLEARGEIDARQRRERTTRHAQLPQPEADERDGSSLGHILER